MTISWSQCITFCTDPLKATEIHTVTHLCDQIGNGWCSCLEVDALYIEKWKPDEGWILSDKL